MTMLFPMFFAAALAAAAAAVALHFIVMRQPPSHALPTARFVPERDARASTISRRPEDLLLLALRVLLLLLIGAAFARPVVRPHRVPVYRIVAVDRSSDAMESARAAFASRDDTLIPFDSSSISAALIAALRTASRMRDRADSVELAIVSPFAHAEFDAATDSIRALWPGALRLIPVQARTDAAPVRAVVQWPADGQAPGTIARAVPDTVGAVVAGAIAVVAPFERRWRLSSPGRVVARWVDGEPAAIERGCERDVAVAVPTAGDVVLRPEYQRFEAAMRAPCGRDGELPGTASEIAALRGQGSTRVAARVVRATAAGPVPLLPWLLAAAILVALAELAVRT
jgi:hypothetical protein